MLIGANVNYDTVWEPVVCHFRSLSVWYPVLAAPFIYYRFPLAQPLEGSTPEVACASK